MARLPRDLPDRLPLLPLRSMALFPGTTLPVDLGREGSVEAVRASTELDRGLPGHGLVIVASQKDALVQNPRLDDLHPVAVLARLTQVLHGLPGRMTVLVRGLARVEIRALETTGRFQQVIYELAEETAEPATMASALAGALKDLVKQYDELLTARQQVPQRDAALAELIHSREPGDVADRAAAHVDFEAGERLPYLQNLDIVERLRSLLEAVSHRAKVLEVKRDIDRSVRDHLSRHEHEAVLRHKLRAIQAELSEDEGGEDWHAELTRRVKEKESLPDEGRAAAQRELARLERMNPSSSEASIARTYVESLLDLPWGPKDATADEIDLAAAREELERGHHGLEKVKKRVLEYLSVRKLAPGIKGPILCLAGPPGVGKTSLGRSIAATLGRRFTRISLGGIRDAAEIRGHRRTYVGAQPGRIIQALRKAGTSNPVILLDEIDKMGQSEARGDPTAALLEALDPEQNDAFEDHYISVRYDLSQVIFICTANEVGAVPHVLRDRLELIRLTGYTVPEKLAIARNHLLPQELAESGLGKLPLEISDELLEALATEYTRESGVRNLRRGIASVLRDAAMHWAESKSRDLETPLRVEASDLLRILGPPTYLPQLMSRAPAQGLVTGLGWTPTGGRLLFVEATLVRGEGRLRLTGRLGDVMKESGQTALSLIRSDTARFGVPPDFMKTLDVHVHLPAGAVPKDGPSAGLAVTIALVSALTHRPVRHDVAMTGEVTLRGHVLPVGGVREKVLAAHRAGIRDIILPERNRKDEPEIPEAARKDLRLHFVSRVEQALEIVLLDPAKAA